MKENLKKYVSEFLEAFIIVIVLYFVLFPAKVDGTSMEGTMYDGDIIFVSRAMASAGLYDEGDIIVFKLDEDGNKRRVIKRIAASEGDEVENIDGQLYINGEIIEGYECIEDFKYKLGKNEYFVLGDNSEESVDSRAFGIIYKNAIEAIAVFKLFPISEVKMLL